MPENCRSMACCVALQLCRPADGKCDAPEYCTGSDAKCPPDMFKPKTEVITGSDLNSCQHPAIYIGYTVRTASSAACPLQTAALQHPPSACCLLVARPVLGRRHVANHVSWLPGSAVQM
jgi:hypothetical protein